MKRKLSAYLCAGLAITILIGLGFTVAAMLRASSALRSATEDVRRQNEFRFSIQPFLPKESAFENISSPAGFVQAAQFQNHLFIAGASGLREYNTDGGLIRQYANGRELPSSPLKLIATAVLADSRVPELLLATGNDGVLAFDGHTFRQILPSMPEARDVNAMLPVTSGHLLLGTSKRGVLVYDGKRLTVFHPTLDKLHVTALSGSDSDLWVGTLDRGVFHFHGGQTDIFSEADGMPDPQVLSLATLGASTFVGTPTGVAVFNDGRFARVLATGVMATAMLATDNDLYVGSEDQGVLPIALTRRRLNADFGHDSNLTEVRQLFASGEGIFAVSRDGFYRLRTRGFSWERVLGGGDALLSDRNVSALATDPNGNLWIGYFDRGLDVMTSGSSHVRHIEDEHVFCVNRILSDPKTDIINVATANGLVRFDRAGTEQQILTRSDGLINDHVTDVIRYGNGVALATPAGLTFLDSNGARSMYAFHGLVNNHVYALGVAGDDLMAGTLGGLSLLHKEEITASYTTTNSGLKHNWITALVPIDSEWLVGTYGAGILALDSTGRFRAIETASGNFEVNPNAMLVTPQYVLAGTLGKGLYVLDRSSKHWSTIRDGLPSLNVTALTAANGYIYVGTDNGLVRIPEQKLIS
jgi:ligand-binding sensor domain-containing protein